jgi:hypothetical protein
MGVSISMRPGTIMRSRGEPMDITPGSRSKGAGLLERFWGPSPCEIDRGALPLLESLDAGASLYLLGEDSFWRKIATAI